MELVEQIGSLPTREESYLPEARPARTTSVAQIFGAWLRPSVAATVVTGFATFGVTAVQGIILARLLGPYARGEFGTAILYTTSLTYIGLLGTQYAIARRAARNPEHGVQLSQLSLRLGVVTGLGTAIVVTVLAFTTLPEAKQYLAALCAVCALALPFEHSRLLLLAVDQGSGSFFRFNVVTLLTSVVFPIALIVLWTTGQASILTAAILTLLAPCAGLILRLVMQRPPRNVRPEPRLKTILGEGLPYSFSVVVCDLYQRLDQFLVLWLSSLVTQGLYAAAVPAAGMLMVGTNALSLFSFNAGSRRQELITIKQVFLAGALVAAFQMILAILLALAIGPLIIFFYGQEFAGAIPFALALIPAHSINGFAQVAEGHLRGRGKIQVGIWARMSAAIVMVVTVSIAFGRLAEMSIPIAATLAHGFVAVILTWFTIADLGQQKREAPKKSRIELP